MSYIPKFRLTTRLVSWVEENHYTYNRLPKNIEEVFFKSKEDTNTIAMNMVSYAKKVHYDNLDIEQEEIIKKNPYAVVQYVYHLHSCGKTIKNDLLDCIKEHPNCLARVSMSVGRLPRELEVKIDDPKNFIEYVSGIRSKGSYYSRTSALRIPEMEQDILLSGRFDPKVVAESVVQYAEFVGKLPVELENLLMGHGEQILKYAVIIGNCDKQKISDDLLNSLAGDSHSLCEYARLHLKKRLPAHLEKTMSDPKYILNYAKYVVKTRLPEEMENHFAKDCRLASQYAFEIIRGFASVRLPEVVHSAMILQSYSNPNDHLIKQYVTECDKDTTVSGSWN